MRKYTLANGSTLDVTRSGVGFDMHLKGADGRTISTVYLNADDAHALIADLSANL